MHLAERTWRQLRATGRAMRAAVLGLVLAALLPGLLLYAAEDLRFFRIGTGSTAGTYFPIGGLIASAISKPPGSRECEAGGSCGVPGLIAVAQSTQGSVANVLGISDGSLDSGLSQADVAYWAYNGERVFKAWGAFTKLRTIANLFPESIHLVVHRDAGIFKVRDIKGKRISLDREGSGTRVDALLILEAYGLSPEDLLTESVAAGDAADLLRAGELDGFFMVVGTPATAITHLANDSLITLVPITGPEADALRADYPFFAEEEITAGTYFNVPETDTLSVGAQWLVSADVPENIVYQMTRALWHENTRRLLDNGHPKGRLITPATALTGLVVPLHPGARRYYSEAKTPFPGKTD